jgi:hypothetical protein
MSMEIKTVPYIIPAPLVGPFDEFDDASLAPFWTENNGTQPYTFNEGVCTNTGSISEAAGKLQCSMQAGWTCASVYQDISGNFDFYVEMTVLEAGGSGNTEDTYGLVEVYSVGDTWRMGLRYYYDDGAAGYALDQHAREAIAEGSSPSSVTYGDVGGGDTIWLRFRYRSGDPEPHMYYSINDGGLWNAADGMMNGPYDMTLLDFSSMRIRLNGVTSNGTPDSGAVHYNFLRDGSGI